MKEVFFGYLRLDNSTGRGLLDTFMKRAEELCLNFADCRGQCYDNGANMKGKKAGVQARLLEINSKALYVPRANHSLHLVVVDCAKSSTEALLFFGVLAQLHTVFSSSTLRWTIMKKHKKFQSNLHLPPVGKVKLNVGYCIVMILLVRRSGCTRRIAELLHTKTRRENSQRCSFYDKCNFIMEVHFGNCYMA